MKGVSELPGARWEQMQLFKQYIEDFNTATFPSTKYYDVDHWEVRRPRPRPSRPASWD